MYSDDMSHDLIIFWVVVLGRFLIPLTILRYPLPGIIASMILDGIDQTIFQNYTHLNLDNYQGYDKALDIYYLAIAYISTMRNWSNKYAYKVSAFLFYYRMIGDLLFQLTQIRAILLIFPNTFEYFFDFYEGVSLRWKPSRLSPKVLVGAAAFIWIFIKLPQEYWIHIAQFDTTDLIKTKIFNVPTSTSFAQIFKMFPLTLPILAGIVILICVLVWFMFKKLPKADHKISFRAIPNVKPLYTAKSKIESYLDLVNRELFEKVLMLSLIVLIFAQVIPGVRVTNIQLLIAVVIILFANTLFAYYIKKAMNLNLTMVTNFVLMIILNVGLAISYGLIAPSIKGEVNFNAIVFFSVMTGFLATLFDFYNPYHQARVNKRLPL